MRLPNIKMATVTHSRTVAITVSCLLLVTYICFLMISNYRKQVALSRSTLESTQLDLEKRAASLGYFFAERKYDVRSLSASREISAYFTYKSLGMSEQYGLKVSNFVINQLFENTIRDKVIQQDKIFERILLVDTGGSPLFDAALHQPGKNPVSWKKYLTPKLSEPSIVVENGEGLVRIFVVAPVFFREQFMGQLIAQLDIETLFHHLVEFSSIHSEKELQMLATADGQLIYPAEEPYFRIAAYLTPQLILQFPKGNFSSTTFPPGAGHSRETLVTRLPVTSTTLNLLAWVPKEKIYGALTPGQLLFGTGSIAVAILLGIGILIWINTQNLILKVRFDESKEQQLLLTSKNLELEAEMTKRLEAEKKLEEQRVLAMRSDRLRSLGEMAAGIAHELNQPLVGVRGLAEMILLNTKTEQGPSLDRVRDHAGRIIEQSDRMVHIINHVRLFAREAGSPETSVVNLNDVVQSGVNLLSAQFRSRGLLLESEFTQQPHPVRINPFSLEEVIVNLLNNARDAVEERKQQEGSSYDPRIIVSTGYEVKNAGETVWMKISDNGNGTPQGIIDKIFDPFFTTKSPDKGTGLGLSICKSTVETFGGNIQFTSREAEGTTVTVEFPVSSNGGKTDG